MVGAGNHLVLPEILQLLKLLTFAPRLRGAHLFPGELFYCYHDTDLHDRGRLLYLAVRKFTLPSGRCVSTFRQLCFAISGVNVILLGPTLSSGCKGKRRRQLPIVAPAPIVTAHADIFRDLFENRCQFRHFQHYLTGLIVLDNKSLANITRCVLESADKTNLSRFFSDAPWFQEHVNDRRVASLLQQTKEVRVSKADAALSLDDTLCEHVGSLFDSGDRHDHHGDDTYPLAHHPVTSHDVSGPVRFPVDLRVSRRDEALTRWEECVHQHVPDRPIPAKKKERARLQKDVDPIL